MCTQNCSATSVNSPPASRADPAALLVERIHRNGPIGYGDFVDGALYGPGGFFSSGGGAGRTGRDFITSPEVGPLFGVCVARALDREWHRLGTPDPFVVVEAGAGTGRLAREVLRAEPECAPALHYVLVERSPALRAEMAERLPLEPLTDAFGPAVVGEPDESPMPVEGSGPIVSAAEEFPAAPFTGVVMANELLDNLAFAVVEWRGTHWDEIRVGVDGGHFVDVPVRAAETLARWVAEVDVPVGTRLPVAAGAVDWIVAVARHLRRGSMILLDYAAEWSELAARDGGWLRTYIGHTRGRDPLVAPGTQDITIDVPIELVRHAAARAGLAFAEATQADWLQGLGIDELVAAGRARWETHAAAPDLAAIAGRSRASEAAALTDPAGLGAHRVMTLTRR